MNDRKIQSDQQTQRARELRKTAIPAEIKIWNAFRISNRTGPKIRRQHPLGPYTLDFYCHAARLCLEIDGASHFGREDADQVRDAFLIESGIETIRVKPTVSDNDLGYFVDWFLEECRLRIESRK